MSTGRIFGHYFLCVVCDRFVSAPTVLYTVAVMIATNGRECILNESPSFASVVGGAYKTHAQNALLCLFYLLSIVSHAILVFLCVLVNQIIKRTRGSNHFLP